MYQVKFSTEDLERFIESLTRYSSYLIDHALRVEVQHTPVGDAAGKTLRDMSKKATQDVEALLKIRAGLSLEIKAP